MAALQCSNQQFSTRDVRSSVWLDMAKSDKVLKYNLANV